MNRRDKNGDRASVIEIQRDREREEGEWIKSMSLWMTNGTLEHWTWTAKISQTNVCFPSAVKLKSECKHKEQTIEKKDTEEENLRTISNRHFYYAQFRSTVTIARSCWLMNIESVVRGYWRWASDTAAAGHWVPSLSLFLLYSWFCTCIGRSIVLRNIGFGLSAFHKRSQPLFYANFISVHDSNGCRTTYDS